MSTHYYASHHPDGTPVPGAPALAAGPGGVISVLRPCLVSGYGATTLTSLVVADGVATATVQTGHGVLDRQVVEITGAAAGALNGQHSVTRISPTAVQWPTTAADGAVAGTITMRVAGAGWGEEFAGAASNQAVFRPAAGLRPWLRIDDTAASTFAPTLYGSMGALDSGSDAVSASAMQRHYSSAAAARWYVIADERWCWLAVLTYDAIGRASYVLWGAGELADLEPGDEWGCAIVTSAQWITQLQALFDASGSRAYRLRSRAGTPGAAQALGVSGVGQVGSYAGTLTATVTSTVRAAPLLAHSGAGVEGRWPGWYQPLAAAAQLPGAGVPAVGWLSGDTALRVDTYGEGAAGYVAPTLFSLGEWR